jgi:hypothetical protein
VATASIRAVTRRATVLAREGKEAYGNQQHAQHHGWAWQLAQGQESEQRGHDRRQPARHRIRLPQIGADIESREAHLVADVEHHRCGDDQKYEPRRYSDEGDEAERYDAGD